MPQRRFSCTGTNSVTYPAQVLPVYALGMLKHPALIENRPPVLPPPWQSGPPSSYPSPSPSPAETPRSASYSNFSPSISPRAGLGLSGLPVTHYLSRIIVRGHERAFELQRMLTCPVQELVLLTQLLHILRVRSSNSIRLRFASIRSTAYTLACSPSCPCSWKTLTWTSVLNFIDSFILPTSFICISTSCSSGRGRVREQCDWRGGF